MCQADNCLERFEPDTGTEPETQVYNEESLDVDNEPLCSICLDPLPNATKTLARSTRQSQLLATVEPCKHQYHDFCIQSWSERANTCPTCRCKFNTIVLTVGGEVFDRVAIKDAVFPMPDGDDFIFDDYDYEFDEGVDPDYVPTRGANSLLVSNSVCILCDEMTSPRTGLVLCNSCSGSFHPNCLGSISHAETWNCPMCDSIQSSDSIVPPCNNRLTNARSLRSLNTFISLLRSEIRTNRRSALGLPQEPISRRRRHLRNTRGNNRAGMFLPPDLPLQLQQQQDQQQETRKIPREEEDAWKLYDKAKKSEAAKTSNSSRQSTPVPTHSHSSADKKVKKPIRKKHNTVSGVADERKSNLEVKSQNLKVSTVSLLISSMSKNSLGNQIIQRPTVDRQQSLEMKVSEEMSPNSLSYSSHETSPTSAFLSSDDDSGHFDPTVVPKANLSGSTSGKLTSELLLLHDSNFQNHSSEGSTNTQYKERHSNLRLSLSQKHLLQQMIVRAQLKPMYNENKIGTDEYTVINKLVSRKLYQQVSENEFHGDQNFIILLNKLIELRERYEFESIDDFAKRIVSDTYTSEQDRNKLQRYSVVVADCIKKEISSIRSTRQ